MKTDKIEISGLAVFFGGVALLAFTFFCAYGFLIGELNILSSLDLVQFFGTALAPLVEAIIHILYLAVMGWIASILTVRGVQLLRKAEEAAPPQMTPPARTESKPKAKEQPRVKEKLGKET